MAAASRLKIQRTSLRITRKDLAARVGVSAKSIQQYEDGQRRPSPGVLLNIAQALGVSVPWLMGESDVGGGDTSQASGFLGFLGLSPASTSTPPGASFEQWLQQRSPEDRVSDRARGKASLLAVAATVDDWEGEEILALLDVLQRERERRGEGPAFLGLLETHVQRTRDRAAKTEAAFQKHMAGGPEGGK